MRFRRWHLVMHSLDVALRRPWVARAAVGAVIGYSVLATVGIGAFAINSASDHQALHRATAALHQASPALDRATTALDRDAALSAEQAIGARARPHLVKAMCDIGQLLTYQRDPVAVPPPVLALLVDLKSQSMAFASTEGQPSC